MAASRKKIGILGGAFDPPHLGHLDVCTWLLLKQELDEVWVVPCFIHPFNKSMAPFEDRYKMCLFTFNTLGLRNVIVSDVERQLGGISYTVRTLEHFTAKYPEHEFHFIVGADNLAEQKKWKDIEKIIKLAPLIQVPRGQGSPIPDISSSEIRKLISSGDERYLEYISKDVAVYMLTNSLYRA